MTDPDLELELEKRFETKADWSEIHRLIDRIGALEKWQGAQDALSTLRRWIGPVLVTVFMTSLNIGITLAWKH